jgi:hypothetical protein
MKLHFVDHQGRFIIFRVHVSKEVKQILAAQLFLQHTYPMKVSMHTIQFRLSYPVVFYGTVLYIIM